MITIRDYDVLTIGIVIEIWTEKSNGGVKYWRVAAQADFNKFEIDYNVMMYNYI